MNNEFIHGYSMLTISILFLLICMAILLVENFVLKIPFFIAILKNILLLKQFLTILKSKSDCLNAALV